MSRKHGTDTPQKAAGTALLILFILGFFLSAALFFGRWQEYARGRDAYNQLAETAAVPDVPPEPKQEPEPVRKSVPVQVDFDALKAVNEDVIGWLYCEGTEINYPVLQGEDDNEYLRTLYNGEHNVAGSLFLDQRCRRDFSDPHPIIYGHRMKDGKMFGALHHYVEPDFCEAHPLFYLLTPEQNYKIHVFSGYVTPADGPAYQVEFSNREDWESYLEMIQKESQVETDLAPQPDQQVITFSTCNYEFKDARFVLHGIVEPMQRDILDS